MAATACSRPLATLTRWPHRSNSWYRDPALRQEISSAASQRIRLEFSMQASARKLEEIYSRHLAKRRGPDAKD